MNYRVFLFVLLIIPLTKTPGQNISTSQFIQCVELKYGPDNLLVNGRPYTPSNVRAEGHPFFQTDEWVPGTVFIGGNAYRSDFLKYHIGDHQLIIKYERPNGTSQKVILSDLLVDSFQISGHLFVNNKLALSTDNEIGYVEKIHENEAAFYRFQKKVLAAPSNGKPYGQFSRIKDVFYLITPDEQFKISQKNDFLNCFPDHKTAIKKHLKDQSLRWKTMSNAQFTQLLEFCYAQF